MNLSAFLFCCFPSSIKPRRTVLYLRDSLLGVTDEGHKVWHKASPSSSLRGTLRFQWMVVKCLCLTCWKFGASQFLTHAGTGTHDWSCRAVRNTVQKNAHMTRWRSAFRFRVFRDDLLTARESVAATHSRNYARRRRVNLFRHREESFA